MHDTIHLVRADVAPDSDLRHQARPSAWAVNRRGFLRVTTAAMFGAGLALVGFFPTAKRAAATNLTPSTTTSSCYGPPYAGSTGCCACGSNVSTFHCGSDNWHDHHSSFGWEWRLRTTSCYSKNAWIWTRGSDDWRCSDGEYRLCDPSCSSWYKSVCPKIV